MTDQLEDALSEAVAARMVADVPVGAFLSGGIDSSTIVALMQQNATGPVRTFTVGFADRAFDESPDAAAVAAHLGTDHTAVHVGDAEAVEVIARIPEIWDEPFSDVSQIPTYLVSRVARREVTVSLSGDGGDELFAGYNRHAWLDRVWGRAAVLPAGIRRTGSSALGRIPPAVVDRAARILPAGWQVRNPSTKVVKLARVLAASDPEDAYRALTTHWDDAQSMVIGGDPRDTAATAHRSPVSDGWHHRADALVRPRRLPARRHPGQARSGRHGGVPRDPSPVPRSTGPRPGLEPAPARRSCGPVTPSGCYARYSNATCRQSWSNGRRWGSACRSDRGCVQSSPHGLSTFSTSSVCGPRDFSTHCPFAGPGTCIGRADGTSATSCGTCWSCRRGSTAGRLPSVELVITAECDRSSPERCRRARV